MFIVFLARGCAGNNTQKPAAPNETTATPQVTGQGKIVDISIKNFAFNPALVTISAGDTVRWTNQDSVTHIVKGSNFESGSLAQKDTYEFTFTKSGTYDYICSIHPSMKGTITVTEKK
jgi:plastocyanin